MIACAFEHCVQRELSYSGWLGVSLFPSSPLCTCLSSIDCFGDHLLGCSHGPMKICRHDALVSILHHALLQDHLRTNVPALTITQDQEIFFTQTFRMVVQPTDFNVSAALYSALSLLHMRWGGCGWSGG